MPTPREFARWVWPPPPIAKRLWITILFITAYTAVVYFLFNDWAVPSKWADELGIINGLVLGALIGFRTKAAYDRWWEGRILWGGLTNHTRNLCLKAVALAAPDAAERRELLRLAAGFPVALRNHLRGGGTLQQVPGFEKESGSPRHVPAALAGRVFALIAGWRRADRIDGHAQQLLDPHAAALMDVCGACERIKNTRLPGSYLSLLRYALILGFLLMPWHLTQTLGAWALPTGGMIVYFLFGMELMAEEVEEPFGGDGDDLPLEQFGDNIRASAEEILGC